MIKKVIVFGGSNSVNSINKQLAVYTANKINNVVLEVLDLNNYDLPLYSIDHEKIEGIPVAAESFLAKIKDADGIVLSLAEHNGAYTAVFKNIFDWMSRIDSKLWSEKPMLLMATSPGARGGATVLEIAKNRFPYMGGNIITSFTFPKFNDNFNEGRVVNADLELQINQAVKQFENHLK